MAVEIIEDARLEGAAHAAAEIALMDHALSDMHDVLDGIIRDIHRQTLAQFASEGAALGDPWSPLAPSTVAEKTREGAPFPDWPLVRTGQMMDSATSSDGPFSVGETMEHEAWLSLDWERDGYNIPLLHQLGVPWRMVTARRHRADGTTHMVSYMWHLPARPFWEATDALADDGADRIIAHVLGVDVLGDLAF